MARASTTASIAPPAGLVRAVRLIETVIAWLTTLALWLSGALLVSILVIIVYSVVWRYLLNAPQPWVDEAAGWLLVACVMLAIPEVQRRNDHIGIDFLHERLKGTPRARWVLGFGTLAVLASSLILVREGITMVEFTHMLGVLSNQLPDVPLWAVQAMVPLGFALVALVAGVQLLCLSIGILPHAMREQLHGELA